MLSNTARCRLPLAYHAAARMRAKPVLFAQAGSSVRVLALSSQAATKVSQELGGQGDNVKVVVRIRPLSDAEQGDKHALSQLDARTLCVQPGAEESRLSFDFVAGQGKGQEQLFRAVGRPIVENCLDGYNSSILAYGQTGSGKTYTMLGELTQQAADLPPEAGLIPRLFQHLFQRISDMEREQENVTDLLCPEAGKLQLREDLKSGVYVEGLSEEVVTSGDEALQLLTMGISRRHTGETRTNASSSRSHCVFICILESRAVEDGITSFRTSRLHLVDLAGSERQKAADSEGQQLKEASAINRSLSALGLVINKLVSGQTHIPYRDSKLTFLLQARFPPMLKTDSLGGNAKTVIIANVSPAAACLRESQSTLAFAQRAQQIVNKAVVNEATHGELATLTKENKRLRSELRLLNDTCRALQQARPSSAGDGSSKAAAQEAALAAVEEEWSGRLAEALALCQDQEAALEQLQRQSFKDRRERSKLEMELAHMRAQMEQVVEADMEALRGRHDAEAALREAQEEMAAQAKSVRHLQQQLAAAEDSPIAGHLTSSPAGRMDTTLRENDRLRAQVQELQTCLGNGDQVIEDLQSSKAEAEREAAAAANAASALQQHLEQAQQELSSLAAAREELLLECDNLRTAVRTSQKGPAADEVSLEAAYRELQAIFHSQHAELESQLADAAAELAEERNIRQQEQSRADRSAAEAAAAKGEIAALKALKKTLAEQVLSQEAQAAYLSRKLQAAKADFAAADEARQKLAQRDREVSATMSDMHRDMASHVEQVQALRADNAQLAHDLAEARAAMSAHAGHAQRADAQQLQREASLQAHVDEAKRGMATAQQRAEEARMERDFFMSQSTEAAGQAASATAERDAAKQAVERLERESDDLRSQQSKTLSDVSLLQQQHDSLKQVAAAQEGELMGRCRDQEARLKSAYAQLDAAAAKLTKSQSDAAKAALAASKEAGDLLQRARTAEAEAASLGKALHTLEQRVIAQKAEAERQLDSLKRQASTNAAQAQQTRQAMSQLHAEVAATRSAHAAATHERDSLQARLADKTAEHAHAARECAAVEARLSDLASTEVSLREELEALSGEVAAVQEDVSRRDAELEHLRVAAEVQNADSGALSQQLAEVAVSKEALREQLGSSRAEHAQEVSDLHRAVAELRTSLKLSRQEAVDLKAEIASNETELLSLGEALSQLQRRESRLKAQNQTLQQESLRAQSLHAEVAQQLQQAQADAAAQAASMQSRLEDLHVSRDKTSRQLQATQAESNVRCAEMLQEIERLRQSDASATAQRSRLQEELTQLQGAKAEKDQAIDAELQQEAECLRRSEASTTAQSTSLQEELTQLQRAMAENEQQHLAKGAELQQEAERLRQSEASTTAQCASLQEELRQLQRAKAEEAQVCLAGVAETLASDLAEEKLQVALAESASLQKELEQAEHAQAGLSGQLGQARRQLQEAEGKLQASQDSLAFVAAEKKALSRQCSEMEQRLNRMQQESPARLVPPEDSQGAQRELQEAQAQLQASREGAAATTREKEAALARCAQLQEELSMMKEQQAQAAAMHGCHIAALKTQPHAAMEHASSPSAAHSSAVERNNDLAAEGYQHTIAELREAVDEKARGLCSAAARIRDLEQDKAKAESALASERQVVQQLQSRKAWGVTRAELERQLAQQRRSAEADKAASLQSLKDLFQSELAIRDGRVRELREERDAVMASVRQRDSALQIIDAQKARLKRELETLHVSLRTAAAEKERADTLACQLRADLADMAAEQDAISRRDQQHAQQLQQQVSDLEGKLRRAACPNAGVDRSQAGKENQNVERHRGDTKTELTEPREHLPEERPHKGVLAAVRDQRYVVALQARPGHVVDVHRYDRMESPPCNAAL
ncbi:g11189 [Coccomyxa viridis]|uniref:G11189 protein n=1 Tax=Coccomyxa viridis TaxID=1274662 RepID=A0ABP1GD48_9CHLO